MHNLVGLGLALTKYFTIAMCIHLVHGLSDTSYCVLGDVLSIIAIGPVVTAPRALAYARDGTAYYQLNHRAQLYTLASAQLKWQASTYALWNIHIQ